VGVWGRILQHISTTDQLGCLWPSTLCTGCLYSTAELSKVSAWQMTRFACGNLIQKGYFCSAAGLKQLCSVAGFKQPGLTGPPSCVSPVYDASALRFKYKVAS
jgi:hypothetical protein